MYKWGGTKELQYRERGGEVGTGGRRGEERLGQHETQEEMQQKSCVPGNTAQRWGHWRSSTKLCFYEHDNLLTDAFSFSATAGPVGVPAKLRSCSVGVTWSLGIWPKVKLR